MAGRALLARYHRYISYLVLFYDCYIIPTIFYRALSVASFPWIKLERICWNWLKHKIWPKPKEIHTITAHNLQNRSICFDIILEAVPMDMNWYVYAYVYGSKYIVAPSWWDFRSALYAESLEVIGWDCYNLFNNCLCYICVTVWSQCN